MKKRFSEQQIVAILKQGEAGVPVKDICRKHNISDATFYTWHKKYRGMDTGDLKRLKQLEKENRKLNRLLADSMLDNDALRAALEKSVLSLQDKRCAIATMQARTGISQRRACSLVGSSRSVLSYRSEKRESDSALQDRLRELAAERKRFGYRRLLCCCGGKPT